MDEEPNVTLPLLGESVPPMSYASSGSSTGSNIEAPVGDVVADTNDERSSTAFGGNVDPLTETTKATKNIANFGGSQPGNIPALVQSKRKKKKKNKGVLLNYNSAMELEYQVQINLIKHNLASMFFASRQFWVFTITQGVLTMIASILAFVASSSLIEERTKDIIATIVGSTSGVVVFLQTIAGVCNYGTRAAMHASAAIDLRDLRDEIVLIKFKVKKEEEQGIDQTILGEESTNRSKMNQPNDDGGSDDSEDSENEEEDKNEREHDNTFGRIQQRYRQSLSGCKSNVPMALSEAFHGMHSNLLISESLDHGMYMRDIYGPHYNYKNIIHFKAFDILASEILNHFAFPLFLPHSQKVVDSAMKHLNDELNKYHQYWDAQLDAARRDAVVEALEDKEHPYMPKHLRQSALRRYAESEHKFRSFH